jgi:hypothetical protein
MVRKSGRERADMQALGSGFPRRPALPIVIGAALVFGLAACQGDPEIQQANARASEEAFFDIDEDSFFDLFRSDVDPERNIGVNRFLWAASLDTLSFLPLEGADPFSGVIVTNWGAVPGGATPYRVTVLITDPALDARSLRVAAFRQSGGRAVPVAEAENRQLENAILTRAREMRIAASGR